VTAPIAECVETLTVALDASGMAVITVTDINDNSTDNCAISSIEFVPNTEIIVNGDFETNAGWVLPNSTSGYSTPGNPGRYMYLNWGGGASTDPTAQQPMMGLIVGNTYTISGDLRNITGCCGAVVGAPALAIDIDGVQQTIINNPGPTWTAFSYNFVATASSQMLAFRAELDGADIDIGIDNINVSGPTAGFGNSLTFDCDAVGPSIVYLQVTDNSGNTAVCTSLVTVADDIDPATPTLADVTGECDATATAPTTTIDLHYARHPYHHLDLRRR